jgi:hypothetical protein
LSGLGRGHLATKRACDTPYSHLNLKRLHERIDYAFGPHRSGLIA